VMGCVVSSPVSTNLGVSNPLCLKTILHD
jgi:hypothetical protein